MIFTCLGLIFAILVVAASWVDSIMEKKQKLGKGAES